MKPNLLLAMTLAGWILFAASHGFAQHVPYQAITFRNFDYVRAVTVSNSYAYFATTGGLIKLDKFRGEWSLPMTGAEGLPAEQIVRLWVDRFDQTLFMGSEIGTYEYDDFQDRWNLIAELPQIDNDIAHVRVPDVLIPQFDATYRGEGEFVDFHARHFETTDIVQDAAGDLWMGTWGFGAARADSRTGITELLPYGPLQDRVDVILPDRSVLWLGGEIQQSYRTGLSGYDIATNTFNNIESGLDGNFPAEDVYCLAADSASLYLGTPSGLYRLNKADRIALGPLNLKRGLLDDIVVSLALTGDSLFVGTAGGLTLLKVDSDSLIHIRPETLHQTIIYDLELVDNTLWIASSAGAFRYTFETDRLQHFQDSTLVLFGGVLNIEHDGTDVWLAADAGVVRLDLATGKTEPFNEPSSRRDQRALAVNERVVALASDRGLTLITHGLKKDRSVQVTVEDGLASDNVRSLLFDGDYLWVGTDYGLTRFKWNDPRWVD
jgi:ligand-binding sensor domain-containing protein